MEQPLEKRTAVAVTGTSSTDLLRLWQGDLVEPLLALLPLKAIATVPAVSRRFRDQQWRTMTLIARQCGTLCTSTSSFLDAVRWTGRDERWSRFDGSNFEAWETLTRNNDTGSFNCSRDGNGRLRIETDRSDSGDHGGGLVKRFDGENLCVRRVTYKFSFDNTNPHSHAEPQVEGFAALSISGGFFNGNGAGPPDAFIGLLVEPSDSDRHMDDTPWFELQWFAMGLPVFSGPKNVITVEPGATYTVDAKFDWDRRLRYGWADVSVTSATNLNFGRGRFKFRRKPLTAIHLYNYTQSISTFDSVNVMYSPQTSRDGAFEGEDSE